MSKRARQSAGTISLFPFLAVLVCAMGALILLLLVTTRRIRQQTMAEQAANKTEEVAHHTGNAMTPLAASGEPLASTATKLSDEPILPLLAPDPAEDLRTKLAALQMQQQELKAAIAERQTELAKLESAATLQSDALANIRPESKSLTAEQERLNQLYRRLCDQQQRAKERAEKLRQQIQQAREQLAQADSKFAVIPYDGVSGTTRRPIIIECTADRLTFASEGVSIKATDMDGFTPRYNPLLYASQALIRYWERRDRMLGEDLGRPYVLLVVRPGGTVSYNIARGLLSGLRQPFGYELVTEDQQFIWPESTSEAAAICRAIIEKMRAERDDLFEDVLVQTSRTPSYSDELGRFQIPGRDQRKRPTRAVVINGQRYPRSLVGDGERSNGGNSQVLPGGAAPFGSDLPESPSAGRPQRHGPSHPGSNHDSAGRSEDQIASSRVHTQQQTAVTRSDRMTEWLRDGTTRMEPSRNDREPLTAKSTSDNLRVAGPSLDLQSQSNELRDNSSPTAAPDTPTGRTSRRSQQPNNEPIRPPWKRQSSRGAIGFDHELRIRVSTSEVSVGDNSAFQLTGSLTNDELQRLLAAAIDQEMQSWGDPPRSFYWMPSVRFTVSPGASQHHQRLKEIIEDWDLRSSTEYVKD